MRDQPMREYYAESPLGMDRVRWGPIIGGVAMSLAALLILTILGLAIGFAAFEPGELGTAEFGTAAGIWGIVSALIAFALGGWFAGYTAGLPGNQSGMLNGMMVGVVSIVLMLWFIGSGLSNLLGAVAGNLEAVMQVGQDVAAAPETGAGGAFETAQQNSWVSLAGLLLALAASAAGGWLGGRQHETPVARYSAEERRDIDEQRGRTAA